jgi:exodeoxyribonuclease-1
MSFVFYDTETTGTHTHFDQILQFAAIKTDAELNPIDQFEIRCRLMPHVIPAPGAMRVTGVTAAQLVDPSLPSHYEMMCQVNAKCRAWSPGVFLGYNSIRFDEELLRQAFYKTLHPLFLTNTERNVRSDVMRMVQAASIFGPAALIIPEAEDGKLVFKLDQLAPANGFAHEDAHDAMGDVLATIHMCRLLMERAPEVWSGFMRFSQKAAAADFMDTETVFSFSDVYFGTGYSWLVTSIGTNPDNSSEYFLYDLSVHPESVMELGPDELLRRLAKKPKLIRRAASNKSPMLATTDAAPAIAAATKLGVEELERRAGMLRADPAFCQRLVEAVHASIEAYEDSPHVEDKIYDGFFPDGDKILLDAFHRSPWDKRLAIVDQLADPRLRQLGHELIHVERPDLLAEADRLDHDLKRAHRVLGTDPDGPWLILPKAIQDLEEMLTASEAGQKAHLQEHRVHLKSCLDRAHAVVHG